MLPIARSRIILPVIAILLTVVLRDSWGDKPAQIGDTVPKQIQPQVDLLEVKDDVEPNDQLEPSDLLPALQKIRQALDGEADDVKAGNGFLDDVLNVIKQRGSILDGSSLDVSTGPVPDQADRANRKALVAEQLLKSSRLLQSLGDADRDRQILIRHMRREARNLLSE